MNVYKVVRTVGKSMFSCTAMKDERVHYEIDKVAYPKVGYLFVFSTFNDALNFANLEANSFCQLAILKGTAEIIQTKIRKVASLYLNFGDFWRRRQTGKRNYMTQSVPKGTKFAKSFKPLTIIRTGI